MNVTLLIDLSGFGNVFYMLQPFWMHWQVEACPENRRFACGLRQGNPNRMSAFKWD